MKLKFDNLDMFRITKPNTARVFYYAQAVGTSLAINAVSLDSKAMFLSLDILTCANRRNLSDSPRSEDAYADTPYNYGVAILNVPEKTLEIIYKPWGAVMAAFNTGRQRSILNDENDYCKGWFLTQMGEYQILEQPQ